MDKPTQKMCDQYRSWRIMEEYFGVKQNSHVWVSLDWRKIFPPDEISAIEKRIKQAKNIDLEYAKLN